MSGELILAVDDDAVFLEMVTATLKSGGYRVVTATDGAAALEIARRENPDLVLLDVLLPKIDGFRVCRLLKFDERHQHVPVLMLTAKAENTAITTGIRTGADRYLTKPVMPADLLVAVREELDRAGDGA